MGCDADRDRLVGMDRWHQVSAPQRKHHCEAARQILLTDFGDLVAKVCIRLLTHGPATLAELARAVTDLTRAQLRNALLVLTQHNVVRFHARAAVEAKTRKGHEVPARPPPVIRYEASIDEIFARPLFPRMLIIVRERLGGEQEQDMWLLLQQLMLWGRLSSEQLLQKTINAYGESAKPPLDTDAPEMTDKMRELHSALVQLQQARFICREVRTSSLLPPPPSRLPSQGDLWPFTGRPDL